MHFGIALFFLIFSHITLSSERNSIPPAIQQLIYNAPCVDTAAGQFNSLVKEGTIEPTAGNVRWCIYILCDKTRNYKIFTIAQKLLPHLSQKWLNEYLNTEDGFELARTRLKEAIENNDETMAAFLLSTKNRCLANTTFTDHSVAHWCVERNRPQILRLMLEAGADHKNYCHAGSAPLHTAVFKGSVEAVKTLLEYGADPDYPDRASGRTPLMYLCHSTPNCIAIAKLLLDAGADLNKTNCQGYTAAQLAERFGFGGIERHLKQFIETYKPSEKLE